MGRSIYVDPRRRAHVVLHRLWLSVLRLPDICKFVGRLSSRRKLIFVTLFAVAVMLLTAGLIDARSIGGGLSLIASTDMMSGLANHMVRGAHYSATTKYSFEAEVPSRQALSLAPLGRDMRARGRIASERLHCMFPAFHACLSRIDPKGGNTRVHLPDPSQEWQLWVDRSGTSNGPFGVLELNPYASQEFYAYQSATPCGIRAVNRAETPFGPVLGGRLPYRRTEKGAQVPLSVALVVKLDNQCNFDHMLREGVLICGYLASRRIKVRHGSQTRVTFVMWEEMKLCDQTLAWHVEFFSALGDVRVLSAGGTQSKDIGRFDHVYAAPWNTPDARPKAALSHGVLQSFMSGGSYFSMDKIVVNRKPLRTMVGLTKAVPAGLGLRGRRSNLGGVMLLQRSMRGAGGFYGSIPTKWRLVVDSKTGKSRDVQTALCNTGLPFNVGDFHTGLKTDDQSTLRGQLKLLTNAAVLVGAHGAGMNNAIWMRPGSVAIEVTLRPGFCCHPIPVKNQGVDKPPCTVQDTSRLFGWLTSWGSAPRCAPNGYTLVNIADMISMSGVRWYYYDPTMIDQPTGDSCRDTTRLFVDSAELADIVLGAYSLATERADSFLTGHGWTPAETEWIQQVDIPDKCLSY